MCQLAPPWIMGCKEHVLRKSPIEAGPLFRRSLESHSVVFVTVTTCRLKEEMELHHSGNCVISYPGRALKKSHLRGVLGKHHLSQSDLQLLHLTLPPPPAPFAPHEMRVKSLNTLYSCGVRVFKSCYWVKELP